MSNLPLLSIIILLPLFSALYIIIFVGHSKSASRDDHATFIGMFGALLTFIATIAIFLGFDASLSSYQFFEEYVWLKSFGLKISLGVDGISLFFILLTSFLSLIALTLSFVTIKFQTKEFLVYFLLFESCSIGAFCSINLLLFYLFFEIILIPMYLIIGIWGSEDKTYAAFKFFIYTFFGSILFLVSIIYIYSGAHTFDLVELMEIIPNWSYNQQNILWLALFTGFAIKVPMIPFHTWLTSAHVQAPTIGSVVLAGILLKLGGYGMIRILITLLPKATVFYSPYAIYLSAFGAVYASFIAFSQTDMKRIVAYSSIAHMGYVTGGIFSLTAEGLQGAIFQMISHGIVSSGLFIIVGLLYERYHTREVNALGGLASHMPKLAITFMILTLGAIGLPGSSGFVGEFFSLIGIFKVNHYATVIMGLCIILAAIYMLNFYRKVMLGTNQNNYPNFSDLSALENCILWPLVFLVLYLGIFPMSILDQISPSLEKILAIYAI